MNFKYKLGFVGFGNMASAIVGGILKNGFLKSEQISFFDISEGANKKGKEFSINSLSSSEELVDNSEFVFLAIKPQVFTEWSQSIEDKAREANIISIMAGVTKQSIKNVFKNAFVARAMPNTPALVGKGVTAIDASEYSTEMKNFIFELFSCVGDVVAIDETEINDIIAVSGSGPAYAYMFLKGMYEKAEKLGFDSKSARELVSKTVIGASEMFLSSDESIDVLIDRVCSKGGTTIEAVKVFQKRELTQIIDEAMQACFDRANELSEDK